MHHFTNCSMPWCNHAPHPASSHGLCADHWREAVNEWDAEQPSVKVRCARCSHLSFLDSADLPSARCEVCALPVGDLEVVLQILDAEDIARMQRRSDSGVVYYLRFGNRIKIGFTSALRSRIAGLPVDEVLAAEPGSYAVESERLAQFSEHLAHGREWFHEAPALLSHIEAVHSKHGDPFLVGRLG